MPAFCSDAAWDAWDSAWQQASTLQMHHAAEQQGKANKQDDDSRCMRNMEGQGIQPCVAVPSRSGTFRASNQSCRTFPTGSVVDIPQFCTQMVIAVYIKKKKGCIICSWQLRDTLHCFGLCEPVFELVEDEKKSYCWIGFCARDLFKHSEAKWRVLPSLFSEALELGPTVYKNGTLVEFTLAAFFCRFPIASAGP